MVTIIGVKFRHQCKCYYFDPRGEELRRGDAVIVETSQGIEYAQVVIPNSEVEEDKIVGELRPIIRIADEDDFDQLKLNRKNEFDAIRICRKKVADHGLEMKLIRAEYAFDRSKLTFFFTADGRVDFRELVKDLAGIFRTRIELRQVGVRDETKLLGGIGICGRELCCATWLTDFVPVSIKMAKEQNLSLNSAKISGICGRLMCCLKNEEDTYEYLNAQMPAVNSRVRTLDGQSGTVSSVDVLRQRVFVMFSGEKDDEKEVREYRVDELRFTPGRKKDRSKDAEEQEEEQQEQQETQDTRQKAPKTEDSEGKENKGDRRPDRDKRPNRKYGDGKERKEQKDQFFKRDRKPDRGRKPERRKDGGNDAS